MKRIYIYACSMAIAALTLSCTGGSTVLHSEKTVTVTGVGTVHVTPDMIQMTVSLTNTASTTKLAQQEVSRQATRVIEILKAAGIEDNSISTASLTFNPEYDYSYARRRLAGQRAEQRIAFSINDIRDNSSKVTAIIDNLIQINGIELNGMSFGVKDNTEYFIKSRELAYGKALQKAQQYASLSGFAVIEPLSIAEDATQPVFPRTGAMLQNVREEMSFDKDAATVLPSGELEVTTSISAVFLLR